MKIAVVGDNCIDVILPPIGHSLVGGNAVNVAVHLARLGAEVSYYGAVGRDEGGEAVSLALRMNGVDISHLKTRDLPTARTVISVCPNGDRHMDFEDFGACDGYTPSLEDRHSLLEVDHVHIGWLNDGGELREALTARGISVSQDVTVNAAPEHLEVEGLAIAFASADVNHEDARRISNDLKARGARGVVVTRGAKGSSIFLGDEAYAQPSIPIKPIDTTGAGDSFIAGFLFAHLSGAAIVDAASVAANLAASTCLHAGGFPQKETAISR